MVRKVLWPLAAQKQLAKAYQYISMASHQNAEKVREEILASTKKLPAHPEMHPMDKFRKIMMEALELMNCTGLELYTG